MDVIQIQDLINKIGEFNKNTDLKEYFENGEEILTIQLETIEESYNTLNQKLLIQLKENSDIELLQIFIDLVDTNGVVLQELYVKYRIKLSESNNTNPVYTKSIPIVCGIIDHKLDYLTNIKKDLHTKIAFFKYKTSTDFNLDSDSTTTLNQNQEFSTASRATFNLSKKESLMLLYVLEEVSLLKFENTTHRKSFIEQNFNFTEVRNNESHGKSFPMTGIQSEYSKFNSNDTNELKSNNKTLEIISKKLNHIIENFEFTKRPK